MPQKCMSCLDPISSSLGFGFWGGKNSLNNPHFLPPLHHFSLWGFLPKFLKIGPKNPKKKTGGKKYLFSQNHMIVKG